MAKKKPETRQPTLDDLISSGYRYTSIEEPPAEPEAQPEKSSFARRALGDTGVALLKGAIGVPEAAVGMADLVSGGEAGRLAEQAGFRPKEAKAILDTYLSPEQQAANQAVQQADGFMAKMGAAVTNPSVIWQGAVESAPSMLGGAAVARGVMAAAPRVAPVVAAGIGEGAVSAGQSAEQIRQETADGTLTGKQAAIAATSGALTGALGVVAGRVAQKLGIGDVDTMLAGLKSASPKMQKGVVRSVLEGAVSEGVLEELPQSVQEQVAQNMALGKPLDEGVDHAAVIGMLAGGLMGGVAGPLATGTPEGKAIRDEKMPEVGPLTKALNAHTETRAAEADAGKPTLTAEQVTLQAQDRLSELDKKAKGTKDTTHPGPDGKPVTIPGELPQYLTPEELKERDFLTQNAQNPEALARAAGATISPFMRQPDAAIPGALPPDTAMARMEDMARQQAQADRFASRSDAAAPAPAPVPAPAVAGDDANPPPEPGDILNPKGEPFKNKMAVGKARKAQSNPDDFVIASVAGGYVLRPVKKEPTDGSVGIPAERGLAGGVGVGAADAGGSVAADGRPADVPGAGVPAGSAAADPQAADAGMGAGGDDAPLTAEQNLAAAAEERGITRERAVQALREHMAAGNKFSYTQHPDGSVTAAANGLSGDVVLELTAAEKKALRIAESDLELAETAEERTTAMNLRREAIAPAVQRAIGGQQQGAETSAIDQAAAEAATSPTNDLPEPTDAQKEAGNYKKGHTRISGLDVTIENPAGSTRRSKADAPTPWEVTMPGHYGYIKGTTGADGDHVDLFIGSKGDNGRFWVINQTTPDGKKFDEHKVITGVDSADEAKALYMGSFADGFGEKVFHSITSEKGADEIKARLDEFTKAKPIDPQPAQPAAPTSAPAPAAEDSPQARWTRSTDAERLGVLGKAGWSVTPPSQSTQRMLKLAWDKMSEKQRSRIATAMESFAPSDPPAEPNAEKNDAPGSNSTEAKNREKAPSARVDGTRQEDLAGAAAATAAQADGVTQSKSPAFDDEVGALDDIEEAPEGFASLPDSATESAPAREQQTVVIELRKRLSVLEQLKGCLAS